MKHEITIAAFPYLYNKDRKQLFPKHQPKFRAKLKNDKIIEANPDLAKLLTTESVLYFEKTVNNKKIQFKFEV